MDFRQSETFRNIEEAYNLEVRASGEYALFAKSPTGANSD